MIRPSDQIIKLINEQYKTIDDAHSSVFDILKFPKVDGIACPELVDYNVRI
ncbi:hypothetical protein ACFRCQ_27555 [Cytobacillus firmus]|uniref:hypothetical protein n=1 Tax=Cytobacillus firmus TaxID=1399 RepID=UPI0036A1A47C